MRDLLLPIEGRLLQADLVLLSFVLGQFPKHFPQNRLWSTLLGGLLVGLSCLATSAETAVFLIAAFLLGRVIAIPRELLSLVYGSQLLGGLILGIVHFQNSSDLFSLNFLVLRSLRELLKFESLIIGAAFVATYVARWISTAFGVRDRRVAAFSFIAASLCCFGLAPISGPVHPLATLIAIILGFSYHPMTSDMAFTLASEQGCQMPLGSCIVFFGFFGFATSVNMLTSGTIFAPSEAEAVAMTAGLTLLYGAILGCLWRHRESWR